MGRVRGREFTDVTFGALLEGSDAPNAEEMVADQR